MDPLLTLLKRLSDAGLDFVLIGGMAATAHGSSYVTRDIDVCVRFDDETGARVVRAFHDIHPIWHTRPDLGVIFPDSPNLRGLKNMYLRTDLGRIDILGELPGVCDYGELLRRSELMELAAGLVCRVVNLDTLIEAKSHANRSKDRIVVHELKVIRQRAQERGRDDDDEVR